MPRFTHAEFAHYFLQNVRGLDDMMRDARRKRCMVYDAAGELLSFDSTPMKELFAKAAVLAYDGQRFTRQGDEFHTEDLQAYLSMREWLLERRSAENPDERRTATTLLRNWYLFPA